VKRDVLAIRYRSLQLLNFVDQLWEPELELVSLTWPGEGPATALTGHVNEFAYLIDWNIALHEAVGIHIEGCPVDQRRNPHGRALSLTCWDASTARRFRAPPSCQEQDALFSGVDDKLTTNLFKCSFLEPLVHLEMMPRSWKALVENQGSVVIYLARSAALEEGQLPLLTDRPYELTGCFDPDRRIDVCRVRSR
jgi:hypothetical protein